MSSAESNFELVTTTPHTVLLSLFLRHMLTLFPSTPLTGPVSPCAHDDTTAKKPHLFTLVCITTVDGACVISIRLSISIALSYPRRPEERRNEINSTKYHNNDGLRYSPKMVCVSNQKLFYQIITTLNRLYKRCEINNRSETVACIRI